MTLHWILFGSRATGSSRIHGHQIHEEFLRQQIGSRLLVAPPQDVQCYDLPWSNPESLAASPLFQPGDTVIFETVRGERALSFARHLRERGINVCFLECDLYPESQLADLATSLICTSNRLAEELRRRHPQALITMIPDPVEALLDPADLPLRARNETRGLRIAWMGQAAHWSTLAPLREIFREPEFKDFEFTTLSNHSQADLLWSSETALSLLRSSDLLVVPVDNSPQALAKSANRVVQGMALGSVVLAGDLPAYQEVIESGTNGYLCRTPDDWRQALRAVRDVAVRRNLIFRAYQSVSGKFSLPHITREYARTLGLQPATPSKTPPALPPGFRAEQSAEYACWYLAQHRYFEGLRWLGYAFVEERNLRGTRAAWQVFAEKCRRKLRSLPFFRSPAP